MQPLDEFSPTKVVAQIFSNQCLIRKSVRSQDGKMLPVQKDINAKHYREDISANKDEKAT
jgi:hypothetical protein